MITPEILSITFLKSLTIQYGILVRGDFFDYPEAYEGSILTAKLSINL